MRTIYNRILKPALLCTAVLMGTTAVKAQDEVMENLHFNIDWQMNAPVSTDFANKISGWGMNFEANYSLTPYWAVGGFINFHTNHRYEDTKTMQLPGSQTEYVTTDQQQSAYQLPFGVNVRYNFVPEGIGHIRPYIGVKTGAMYAKNTTYLNSEGYYDNPWGYYVSPEIGLNIYPSSTGRFGFHLAGYFSYATNQSKLYLGENLDGQKNVGFRVGITF